MKQRASGFTILEILIVIAIIGLLTSIVIGSLQTGRQKATEAAMSQNFHVLKINIEQHFNEYGQYNSMCDPGTAPFENLVKIADSYGGGTPEPSVNLPGWQAGAYYSCYVNQGNQGLNLDYVFGVKLSDTSFRCIDSTGGQIQERQGTDNCFYDNSLVGS